MGLFDSATASQSSNQSSNTTGKSTSESTTTVETLPKYYPEQEDLLKYLVGSVMGGLSGGVASYPGKLWADINPYEQTWLSGNSDTFQNREAAIRQTLSGQPGYTINEQTTKDYWDKYMMPQIDKQERLLRESYANNYFGGGKDIALGEFNTGVAGQYANLQYQDEQARRAAIENALNRQAQNAVPAWMANEDYEQQRGQLQRQVDEAEIASNYLRWMNGEEMGGVRNEAANPFFNQALALMGISPYIYMPVTESSSNAETYGTSIGTSTGTSQGAGAGYSFINALGNSLGGTAVNALTSGTSAIWDYIKNNWGKGTDTQSLYDAAGSGYQDAAGNLYASPEDYYYSSLSNPSTTSGIDWDDLLYK